MAIDGSRPDGLWYWELESGNFQFSPHWAALARLHAGRVADQCRRMVQPGPSWLPGGSPGGNRGPFGGEPQEAVFQHEHRLLCKDGSYVWVTARGTAVRGPDGKPVAVAGAHANITSIMSLETRVLEDTFHDKLTSLPNRMFFLKQLELAIERDQRQGKAEQPVRRLVPGPGPVQDDQRQPGAPAGGSVADRRGRPVARVRASARHRSPLRRR